VYLTISGQEFENVFSPSETHVSLDKLRKDLKEFDTNLLRKRTAAERNEDYREAGNIQELMDRVGQLLKRVDALGADDVTDEKYQIDEAKREIARRMHAFYNKSVLVKTLEEYYEWKSSIRMMLTFNKLATDADRKSFEEIIATEKNYIASDNVQLISMKITEMKALATRINSRQEITNEDIIHHFSYLKNHPFQDQKQAKDLIRKGEKALDKNSFGTLTEIVNQLYFLKKQEQKNDPDTFSNSGTGLR